MSSTRKINDDLLVRVTAEDDQGNVSIYAIDKSKKISSGSYGVIYKAYPVNPETNAVDRSKKLAAKMFKDMKRFNSSEVEIFSRYYETSKVALGDDHCYQIMNYLPGRDLYAIDENGGAILSSDIQQLNFLQRISLIQNILMFVSVLHHETPSTGAPLIHSDLNGENIRLKITEIEPGQYRYDVYLIDFGIANEADVEPNELQDDKRSFEGSPVYMPLEVFKEQRGIKSDIYSLAAIFMIILGARAPFKNKYSYTIANDEFYKTEFCFEGVLTGFEVPEYPQDIANYLLAFLHRMQRFDYNQRPDTQKALRFFTTLENYCRANQLNENLDDNYVRLATLALLASGLWEIECDKDSDDPYTFSFENLNLDSHVNFCLDVVLNTRLSHIMTSCELSRKTFDALLIKHQICLKKSEPEVIIVRQKSQPALDKDDAMPIGLALLFTPPSTPFPEFEYPPGSPRPS